MTPQGDADIINFCVCVLTCANAYAFRFGVCLLRIGQGCLPGGREDGGRSVGEGLRVPRLSAAQLCCAVGTGLLLAWWSIYHEEGYLFQADLGMQVFSCVVNSLGIAGVGAVSFLGARADACVCDRLAGWPAFVLALCAGLALDACLWGQAHLAASLLQAVVSAAAFFMVIENFKRVAAWRAAETAAVFAGALGVFALAQLFMFALATVSFPFAGVDTSVSLGYLFQHLPELSAQHAPAWSAFAGVFWLRVAAHTALLAGACLLLARFRRAEAAPEGEEGPRVPHRAPARMLVHIVTYSVVFGMTHALASGISSTPLSKTYPEYVGVLLAGAVVACALMVDRSGRGVWPKIKALVFPFGMLAFILLPFAHGDRAFVSVCLAQCATMTYYALLFYWCIEAARKLKASPCLVLGFTLLVAACAYAVGTVVGDGAKAVFPALNETAFSLLTMVAFILLVAGTFWVGSDRLAERVWGLEKKLPAKQYNDDVLERQCAQAARAGRLTPREADILLRLMRGQSAAQIAEDETVTINTVRTHIARIHRKLGVHSQAELAARVREEKG